MKRRITSFWRYGTCYCSLEMTTLNGKDQLFGITSEKKKEEYAKLDYLQAESIGDMAKRLKKNQHLQLIVNTDQVLVKKVDAGLSLDKAVAKAFPSVSTANFYFELLDTGEVAYVAVCKKEYINGILETFRMAKLYVVAFRLGFGSLVNLMPVLKTEMVATSKHYFSLTRGQLFLDQPSDTFQSSYQIDEFQVQKQFILPLASLLNYDVKQDEKQHNFGSVNRSLNTQYSEINFFRKTLITSTGILLVLLLTNFLFFSSYFSKHESLKVEASQLENKAHLYQANFEKVRLKERRVENIFSAGNSKSSLYLNRLVSSKPESVLFIEFQYQPLLKRIKTDKKIEYTEGQIIIGGESGDKELFSKWMEDLEQNEWISEVTILSYGLEGSSMDNFRILIQLSDATEN
ncbi:MAG: hypothetical protein AAF489_08805 [Bacteroidota bacterium]